MCENSVTYPFSQYSFCNHAPQRWETSAGLTCKYICAKNFWVSSSWNEHGASKGGILKKGKDHLPNISFLKCKLICWFHVPTNWTKTNKQKVNLQRLGAKSDDGRTPAHQSIGHCSPLIWSLIHILPKNYQSSPLNIGVLPQRWKPTQTPSVPTWGAFADSSGRVHPSFSDRNSSINSLPP